MGRDRRFRTKRACLVGPLLLIAGVGCRGGYPAPSADPALSTGLVPSLGPMLSGDPAPSTGLAPSAGPVRSAGPVLSDDPVLSAIRVRGGERRETACSTTASVPQLCKALSARPVNQMMSPG